MNATETRSGTSLSNLQETLDADGSATLEQYLTPVSLARELAGLLPTQNPATVLDPQCGSGNLLNIYNYAVWKFGIELDDSKEPQNVNLIHANCVKIFEAVEQLMPALRFAVASANPPFGRHWKLSDGTRIDSTLATWNFVTRHAGCGYFIANASTIEKFGLHESTDAVRVIQYEQRQACQYWDGLRPELQIGIVIWERRDRLTAHVTPGYEVNEFWKKLVSIMDEERTNRPPYNIWLDRKGFLETYLSQRTTFQHKLTDSQIQRLHRIKGSHPLALTPEKETRDLLRELIDCGLYTISPEAEKAITDALSDVNRLAVPIMPVNSFELVAYTDEEETLVCHQTCTQIKGEDIHFTAGKSYKLSTGSYKFSEEFKRDKVHFDEKYQHTFTKKHHCVLSGSDRYISVCDDFGCQVKFLDRPRKLFKTELPEALLWDYFKKPVVETVAEQCRQQVETNLAVLKACEMLAGYEYFPGQLEYLARVASKDRALIAAETGTGKSLFAISMLALKSPKRALLIAPQGTMRASRVDEDEDDNDDNTPPEMSASQWVKELHKFAPYIQVWEIFKYEDYEQILALNDGKLPYGLFVTYYEAFFQNGGKEQAPPSWDDEKLNKYL
jgi:predicted RNA methylase